MLWTSHFLLLASRKKRGTSPIHVIDGSPKDPPCVLTELWNFLIVQRAEGEGGDKRRKKQKDQADEAFSREFI